MSRSPRDIIGAKLPKSWSQTKRDEIADEIEGALWEAGFLADEFTTVSLPRALVPVETVEAYGLEIKLDANGEASEITCPAGLVVLA